LILSEAVPNKGGIGKSFKKEAKVIMEQLAAMSPDEVAEMDKSLTDKG
jgi:glycyl-tRNA synthetase